MRIKMNSKVTILVFCVLGFFLLLNPSLTQAGNYNHEPNGLYQLRKENILDTYGISEQNLELITQKLWDDIYSLLLINEEYSDNPVVINPWDLIREDIHSESGFGVLLMYDCMFECEDLITEGNSWFVEAIMEYSTSIPWRHLGFIMDESEILNRLLTHSMAYRNAIDRYSLRTFIIPGSRSHLIDDYRREFDYSKQVETRLRWDGLGNIDNTSAAIMMGRIGNSIWTALDLVWKDEFWGLNLLLAIDAQGNSVVLSNSENIFQQLKSDIATFDVRQNQIFILSDEVEEIFGIVTESGLFVMDPKIILFFVE